MPTITSIEPTTPHTLRQQSQRHTTSWAGGR
jgi:hypothetical protein